MRQDTTSPAMNNPYHTHIQLFCTWKNIRKPCEVFARYRVLHQLSV